MPNNIGAFGENFPYTNQHDMNMDWVIKIAKDFLDQYTSIQQIIADGMTGLEDKATELENLLQAWYDTHSEDIANQLADALQDLNDWYTQHQGYLDDYVTSSITLFTQQANAKALETLQTIPEDYTVLSKRVVDITGNEYGAFDNDILFGTEWTIGKYCNPSGGNLITNAGYNTSDYIPSAPMKVYYIPDHTGVFVHFFDSSKTFISGRAVTNPLFSTPSNTRFIRISVEVSNPNSTHVITDEIVEMTDYIKNTTWTDDIYIEGGQTHTNTAWTTSDFIPVYASRYVTMFNCAGCFFNYYDNNHGWLSGYSRLTDATLQLPTDERTAYLKISLQKINQPAAHLNGNVPTYTTFGKSAFNFITQHKKSIKPEIHIGQGYQFTTLREGIAYACNTGNCKVFVHPGTYDLAAEFANEISDTMSYAGIGLGNNVEIYFYDGAKVTANISYDQYSMEVIGRTTEYFNPFYSFAEGDWKLENLNIEATNTRYCVHDETSGTGVARHEMKNCRMIHNNDTYYYGQCVGGGLGRHSNIIIDGGYFESHMPTQNPVPTITYHNGNNSECESSIHIKNVYIASNGKMSFGYYGPSTAITPVEISSCSVPNPIELRQENQQYNVVNMEIIQFCNEIRN